MNNVIEIDLSIDLLIIAYCLLARRAARIRKGVSSAKDPPLQTIIPTGENGPKIDPYPSDSQSIGFLPLMCYFVTD